MSGIIKLLVSARFWLKKLLAQVHATQNIYLHNIVGTCTKEGLNKENTTQIAKLNTVIWFLESLLKWAISLSSCSSWNLWLKKLHAQCACRLEILLAQRKKSMHLCKCACVKSSTAFGSKLSIIKFDKFKPGNHFQSDRQRIWELSLSTVPPFLPWTTFEEGEIFLEILVKSGTDRWVPQPKTLGSDNGRTISPWLWDHWTQCCIPGSR